MALTLAKITTPVNASKVNYYGIEVEPEVTWKTWEPGNKYTKKLILKNVKFSTQKLNFKVPNKECFITAYPKTITLSAGTSYCLPITFRPDEKAVYEDQIVFETTSGERFSIPVKGLLPQFSIHLPKTVSCGLTAAHDVTTTHMELKNNSELPTPFRWSFEAPFSLDPSEGVLQPHQTIKIIITVRPPDAQTYILDAICCYGNNYGFQKTVQLENIAKYPQVMINIAGQDLSSVLNEEGHILVDFGTTSISLPQERMIMIQNPSSVSSNIKIERLDCTNPKGCVFTCPVSESLVPPKSSLNIISQFSPKLPWTRSVEYFKVTASNTCGSMTVKFTGQSNGPNVSLSSSIINFLQIEPGQTLSQPLEVINSSPIPMPFQFVTDASSSVFQLSKIDGIIPVGDKAQIVITFRPQAPIQFYRRLVCLVPDQDPLFVDLLGTCHDLQKRPHILQARHLRNHNLLMERGLSFFPPEQLNQFIKEGKLSIDDTGAIMLKEAEELEQFCDPIEPLEPVKEYFFSNNDSDVVFSVPHVSVDRSYLDFSDIASSNTSSTDPSIVHGSSTTLVVKNNTRGALILYWTQPQGCGVDGTFSITPATAEIPANRAIDFKVTFNPTGPDRFFSGELEAFASYKSQRDIHMANDATVAPPFCLTVRCIGHSFGAESERFLPHFEFDRSQVIFPSITPKETVFRWLSIANTSQNPMYYKLGDLQEPFSVKPRMGVLYPGSHQIFSLCCSPNKIQHFSDLLKFFINQRLDTQPEIPILGSSDNASILLDNDGELYFIPTNVGNISKRNYVIKNVSSMPLIFEWKIRHADGGVLSVHPTSGHLEPNEAASQTWTFMPDDTGKRVLKPHLVIRGRSISGLLAEPRNYPLRIITMATNGALKCQESYIDFGTVVVGCTSTKTITLYNESDCTIYYRLVVRQTIEGPYPDPDIGRDPDGLELSITEGSLPGRCKQTVRATVRAFRRLYYQHQILCYLMNNPDDPRDLRCLNEEPEHLCHLLVHGGYPTLQITDVQGTGSARGLSKRQLWNYMTLDNFNVCLDSDPSASELLYTVATRQSYQRRPPVLTRAVLDLNLGGAALGTPPSEVHLLIENPGLLTCQFNLVLPEDLVMELEYWAESGEYTPEELHEMKVQENRLFDVSPRKVTLEGGQSTVITISYKHTIPGTDRLPILMKIDKGRELMLNLVGVTVDPTRRYIHFPSRKHVFTPTPIGEARAPLQIYELFNGGSLPLHFALDVSALEQLKAENHHVPILECLTTDGHILPGRTTQIQWKFTPLEAKTYVVDIPIHVTDGESAVITFTGIGYDQRQLGSTLPLTSDTPVHPDPSGQATPFMTPSGSPGVPSIQSIPLPGQLAFLSDQRVSLGHLPLFCRSRRVIFLNNMSSDREITFAWFVTSVEHADLIHVSPQRGCLGPKESALCHVTFTAKGSPAFFDIALICEVSDVTELEQYQLEVAAWEEEMRRQREEFTIDEKNPEADKIVANHMSGVSTPVLKTTGLPNDGSAKYKTLPPIPNRGPISTSADSNKTGPGGEVVKSVKTPPGPKNSRGRQRGLKDSDFLKHPSRPQPFLLHLGVTGRIYSIEEYQTNFPHLWNKQFIDKTLLSAASGQSQEVATPSANEIEPTLCTDAESHVIETALTSLVRSLLSDSDLLGAIRQLPDEPVPFYRQLPDAKMTVPPPLLKKASTMPVVISNVESPRPLTQHLQSNERHATTEGSMVDIPTFVSLSGSQTSVAPLSQSQQVKKSKTIEKGEAEREMILQAPGFGVLVEGVLENMLANIVSEANNKEFDPTIRPRLIALPPRKSRTHSGTNSKLKNRVTPSS